MVHSMKLHENLDLFGEAIRATADYFSTRDVYIEKDYYDIHQLLIMDRVKEFCCSEDFFEQLEDTLQDDSSSPTGNKDWLQQDFTECLFFHAPEKIWPQLSSVYNTDFKEMMFGQLPPEDSVVETLAFVGSRLADFDKQK